MMENEQIEAALQRLFAESRVVFWNDADREFSFVLPFLQLPDINVVNMEQTSAFAAKILIEREKPAGRFLIYSPCAVPDPEQDWLLDIRLYSSAFRADRASMILSELGLASQNLREHIAARRKFFESKERLARLKGLVQPGDTRADIDRKMIAVAVRADQPEWFIILPMLFDAFNEAVPGTELDVAAPQAVWEQLEKFSLTNAFWDMARQQFGYSDQAPDLRSFLIRMMVTDYAQGLKGAVPSGLRTLVLPKSAEANAAVFLAQWRDSSARGGGYDRLSAAVAALIKLPDLLEDVEFEQLLPVMTFLDVEKAFIRGTRDRLLATADVVNAGQIREMAARRQAGHWASLTASSSDAIPRAQLHAAYDALISAAEFFELRNQHRDGFQFTSDQAMYLAYETRLFRFDQLYRHVCEAADIVGAKGADLMKEVRALIEATYVNWFLTELALSWGRFFPDLLTRWEIVGVPRQEQFFETQIKDRIGESDRRKSFVIISDAFRYEVAEELTRELNGRYRFQAELTSQLGVLPSYTSLGMACLLPHRQIEYRINGEVTVDGKPVSTLELRNEALAAAAGVAVSWDELKAMKKEAGRELISGKRVIYIYHNAIDATGDQAGTEKDTFTAVRRAINDLATIVSYVINNLNGNHLLVTADHGFLFTESAPGEPEKSALGEHPLGTVKAKKRYVLGRGLPVPDGAWKGDTAVTAGASGGMEFWIPRGINRFHFAGGSRFFHGGAMLQEIVIPIITVRQAKGKSLEETRTRYVPVHVLGLHHKVTTSRHRFELIQMEAASERVKGITLKIGIYEGDTPVTSIETITFDSASASIDDRKKWVTLVLKDGQYDKRTSYRLTLRDAATGVEQQSVPIIIDRAFRDEF